MNNKFAKLSKPYLFWLYVFAVFPAVVMLLLVFINTEGIDLDGATFTFGNFAQLGEASTLVSFRNSLLLAAIATFACIVLGYLVAYKLYRSHFKNKFLILVILVLPMWSNILLRTNALAYIMEPNNIISSMLGVEFPEIRGTMFAVVFGLVVTYLPFMVMPIYNALEKIDPAVEEAALDLGLTDFKKFWKVILPISSKGIVTGSIMVFLPCLSGFAIPEILGNGNIVMLGNVIESLFKNMNYNIGALLSLIVLILIIGAVSIVNKVDKEGELI